MFTPRSMKLQNNKEIVKDARGKRQLTFTGKETELTTGFLMAIIKANRLWTTVLEYWGYLVI